MTHTILSGTGADQIRVGKPLPTPTTGGARRGAQLGTAQPPVGMPRRVAGTATVLPPHPTRGVAASQRLQHRRGRGTLPPVLTTVLCVAADVPICSCSRECAVLGQPLFFCRPAPVCRRVRPGAATGMRARLTAEDAPGILINVGNDHFSQHHKRVAREEELNSVLA